MDQAGVLRKMARNRGSRHTANDRPNMRGIAVASGKGGVGKTSVVANLAFSLNKTGLKTLVFDADMGLGNIHILLGLAPRFNLEHVLSGEKTMEQVIFKGPGGIDVLPASSGNRNFSELTGEEKLALRTELEALEKNYDIVLFDIGAGISSNVMYFCSAATDVALVTTAEPTAFADAYALMKILARDYDMREFKIIVNNTKSLWEARGVCDRLEKVADRFGLNVRLDLLGHIVKDDIVSKSVRRQRLFTDIYPRSQAAECVERIAKSIAGGSTSNDIEWGKVFA
ncbi:Flagellar synthesis regulator FleN [hydrothermal vent metagenome]|uniref:Flagellar synthesis regulator FleN n=1 Tax=hydrothermal vent metagenome TaxID=652676 RepID=A0A3B1CBS0_9ZZZZ